MNVDPVSLAIKPLDLVAVQMEAKWGAGVLPQLVSPDMAAKFRRAQDRLDEAILTNDYDTIKGRADALIRGWQAMDLEATKNGHDQDNIPVKLVTCADGVKYAFCEDRITASRWVAKHPSMASATLTFEDIANVLQAYSVAYSKPGNDKAGYFTGPQAIKGDYSPILIDEIPF